MLNGHQFVRHLSTELICSTNDHQDESNALK